MPKGNELVFRLVVCLLLEGCISGPFVAPFHQPSNYRDYEALRFTLRSNQQSAFKQFNIVKAYQTLGGVLYSKCKNLPSDSEYVEMLADNAECVDLPPIFWGVARTLWEQDRSVISPNTPFIVNGNLRWVDVPEKCKKNTL
jgi:hypothetical protein